MRAETPPNADRFTRAAHYLTHDSTCLHIPNKQKIHAIPPAKSQATSQAKSQANSQAESQANTDVKSRR